jgi:hypothetical protein
MARVKAFEPRFVETMPKTLVEGALYVSMEYATAIHLCACGCGTKVVTPLSPTDWRLTYDGAGVTLHPSIGNWSFPCRSHYFIRGNLVRWSGDMDQGAVEAIRKRDRRAKAAQFREVPHQVPVGPHLPEPEREPVNAQPITADEQVTIWARIRRAVRSWRRR